MTTAAKGKRVEVEIHTDTYRIRGTLFIPQASANGYNSRLSDFLNIPDKRFLALSDAHIHALPDPSEAWDTPFLAVNKDEITMVRALKGE
jgi:hypothetical protein